VSGHDDRVGEYRRHSPQVVSSAKVHLVGEGSNSCGGTDGKAPSMTC